MVLLCPSAFLCYFVAFSYMSSAFAERRSFCSSEYLSIWYSYEGPLYYLSLIGSPCSPRMTIYNITYTVIPMFTIARVGFHAVIYYKGQLWFEHTQPDVPCEDFKICYIIKGETLHETASLIMKMFVGPQGNYQIFIDMNIVDDIEKRLTVHFNVTIQYKLKIL